MFSRGAAGDMWVMLLEKAYAKLHGNYFTLRGGQSMDALMDLTGFPTCNYDFTGAEVQNKIKDGSLFKEMRDYESKKYCVSVSTPGEEMWADSESQILDSGLLAGHSYTVLETKATEEGVKMIRLRNPWGRGSWKGPFSSGSSHWTQSLMQQVQPDFDDRSSFWMNFKDFAKYFKSLNVCKVKPDAQVLRFKGEFEKGYNKGKNRASDGSVRSRYQYEMVLDRRQEVNFMIHQEDIRTQGVLRRRPYFAMGICLFKRNVATGEVEFVKATPMSNKRQVQLEIELDAGHYFVVPRTSGCGLMRPLDAKSEGKIPILKKNGDLSTLVEITVKDIFKRLDKVQLENAIGYEAFSEFIDRGLGDIISIDKFDTQVIGNYCSTANKELTLRGFLDWFKDFAKEQKGTSEVMRLLNNWGYDEDLYPISSRTFVMTSQSDNEVKLMVQDRRKADNPNPALEDIEDRMNCEMIKREGKSVQEEPMTYNLFLWHNEETDTFSFAIKNQKSVPAAYRLDCTKSVNMVFNEDGGKVTRYIRPGELTFMMHVEAAENVEEFTLQYTVSMEEI